MRYKVVKIKVRYNENNDQFIFNINGFKRKVAVPSHHLIVGRKWNDTWCDKLGFNHTITRKTSKKDFNKMLKNVYDEFNYIIREEKNRMDIFPIFERGDKNDSIEKIP